MDKPMNEREDCITMITDSGESVDFYVLEETRIHGKDYLLVTDAPEDEDGECYILKDFSTEVKSKREIPREKLRKNADTSGKPAQIPPAAPPQWKDAGEGRAVHFPEKML